MEKIKLLSLVVSTNKLKKNKINNSKLLTKLIFIILLGIISFNVASTVWPLRAKYFSANYWQRFPALEKVYLSSQYVNKHPAGWVPDEAIQAYAGGAFIKGMNPVLVLPDTPPLGKYLVGLSTIIFNNENTVILIFSILSLVLLYTLSYQIFSSRLLALIPPFLLSFEPIFKNQLVYAPLLDIIQLVFLLSAFVFFNKALSSKKSLLFLLLANVFVGFFISTKFFITGVPIEAAFYLILLFRKDKRRLFELTFTIPIAGFILLLSYVKVFAFGYTINKFLGIQKWVFLYHRSQLILPLSIWPLILLNKWYVWYGNKPVISDPQWLITWPIVTLLTFVTTLLGVLKKLKINRSVGVIIAWVIFYFALFSFGEITSRYFVILIPVLYVVAVFGVVEITKRVFHAYK
jgi:hypothetical protein